VGESQGNVLGRYQLHTISHRHLGHESLDHRSPHSNIPITFRSYFLECLSKSHWLSSAQFHFTKPILFAFRKATTVSQFLYAAFEYTDPQREYYRLSCGGDGPKAPSNRKANKVLCLAIKPKSLDV